MSFVVKIEKNCVASNIVLLISNKIVLLHRGTGSHVFFNISLQLYT